MSACDTLAPRRAKVAPRKGFSHMDWITLNRKAKSMTSVGPGDAGAGEYTLSQVREHRSKYNAWMVLRGRVYDVTKYVPYHPGGAEELLRGAGIDGTALFDQYHKWVNTDFLMKRCCVGVLVPEKAATAATAAVAGEGKAEVAGKAADSWTTLSLVERAELSATSIMLRFSADKTATASWGQCFSHLDIRRAAAGCGGSNRSGSVGGSGGSSSSGGGSSGGSGTRAAMLPPALPNTGQRGAGVRSVLSTSLSRAYTPVSVHAGTVILALRVYKTGQMSRHLAGLAVGDSVQAQCSNGGPDYLGGGKFSGMARIITDLGKGGTTVDKACKAETVFKRIAMVAGGSGITPMFQLIQAVLQERLAESKAEGKMGDASMYSPSAAVEDDEEDDEDDKDEDGGVELMLLAVCRTSSDVMLFNELKAATVQFEGKLKVQRGQAWIAWCGTHSLCGDKVRGVRLAGVKIS